MKGSRTKRFIRIVLPVVVVLVLISGYAWFHNLTRAPLPQHDGELRVAGLNDTVEILRDEWGIPHIYASSMHDLFFAQGYTQAQDRWWQMEFFRHVGSGTIEELVGKNSDLLAADIFLRSLGWRHVAEQEVENYDHEALAHAQAFTDGVNAYIIGRDPGELALEYSILGLTGSDIQIEPWTLVDSLTFAKVMALELGFRGSKEELRSTLYELLGQEMTDKWLTPPWPFGEKPTIIQPEDLPITESTLTSQVNSTTMPPEADTLAMENTCPNTHLTSGDSSGPGSNNWVVSGSMTASGMPLLANDPHLGIQMPSIWYQIGLHCQPANGESPLDIAGFAFAPSPGIIIGHNNFIA